MSALQVYPNPVNDKATISGLQKETNIQVYDAVGNLVLHQRSDVDVFNTSEWSQGCYLLKEYLGDQVISQTKIVKQ
jgi:hypothetical protein